MKTARFCLMTILVVLLPSLYLIAQEKGSGNIVRTDRTVAAFDAINVGCAINLYLSQGDAQKVSVETDENLQDRIRTKVNNGVLILSCDNIRNASKMNVYVTVTDLKKLEASGASVVKGQTPLNLDHFELIVSGASKATMDIKAKSIYNEASGASKVNLTINADDLVTDISGASDAKIKGMAVNHKADVSGAGNLKSMELVTDNTDAEVSGAGKAAVMARKKLKSELSGAGSLTYFDNTEVKRIAKTGEYNISFSGMDDVKSVNIEDEQSRNNDEETVVSKKDADGNTEITINNDKIVVVTDDSVTVKLGDKDIVVDKDWDMNVKPEKKHKERKFDGHWTGLELGVNGYLTPDMDFNYPSGYSLLDQKYQKSINVNLNFFEQNINLIRNHLGLVTGLGLSWNNYRLDNNVRFSKGENGLVLDTVNVPLVKYEKSKLVNTYLTLPLMLEYQTNKYAKVNSFHISAGVVGGWRIGTHAKYVFDDGSRQKQKDRDDFYMNPFKLDAVAKIGWGVINLYATYSLTPMFQKNKGPELYPFSVGICLTDLTDL